MEDKNVFVNRIIIILYFMVAFIPNLGAHEIVNTQWFYIAVLNVFSLGYIFFKRKEYDLLTTSKLAVSVFIGSFLFLLISLLSITKSILVSESVVTLSYLVLTIVALFVFYVSVKQNPKKYFEFLCLLIASIGTVESLQVVNYFVSHNNEMRTNELLTKLTHNYGNRNILAISIAMKFPFIFYLYVKENRLFKYVLLVLLMLVFTALFLIGARTAIFSSTFMFVMLLGYLFLVSNNYKKVIIKKTIPILLVGVLSLFFSLNLNKINARQLNSFDDLVLTKNKKDLLYARNKEQKEADLINGSGREKYWQAAIEDVKKSPLLGIGLGNWKLMPKKELISTSSKKNYFYPKRVHNDFLQLFSEVGVLGFLIYITLYILMFCTLLKRIFNRFKESKKEEAFITVILLASLLIYFLDSFFNFPHERTPIQVFTFFILALVLGLTNKKNNLKFNYLPFKIVFLVLSLVFLAVSFKGYQASKAHKILYTDFIGKDFFKEKYSISYDEMLNILPGFPELDAYGRATPIMKAFFAYNSKKKNKALQHLDEAIKMGPYHAEPLGVKALLYFQDKDLINKDSALFYAKKAFEIQPSKSQNFEILRRYYAGNNDTINLMNTLNTYTRIVPKDVDAWIKKAEHLYVYKKGYDRFLEVIDSAYALNPNDEKIRVYRKKQSRFKKKDKELVVANNVLIEKYYNKGIKFFNQKKYTEARKEFHEVLKLKADNMATLINLGVLERVCKNYTVSIQHLTKVINGNFMKNGQPEYNRGLCYSKLGDKDKAMQDFEVSRIKGYKSAQKAIDKIKSN